MSEALKTADDLAALLAKNGVPHQLDKANGVVQIATRPPALPIPVIVRFETKIPYINIIQQMTGPIPEDRTREIETAISHVNDVAMIPGYGYSYANKVAYYRLAVPYYSGAVDSDDLDKAMTAVLNNAKQLEQALKKVIEGGAGANILSSLAQH
jgi:hypothetical protein